ncbi:MAG TPA: hypothetical protein VOB72_20450 [Candidatus Dormibacteraeota bacterium]|nr:hypothetical protein [Candidatus Dormibacteraeota bacterium]
MTAIELSGGTIVVEAAGDPPDIGESWSVEYSIPSIDLPAADRRRVAASLAAVWPG